MVVLPNIIPHQQTHLCCCLLWLLYIVTTNGLSFRSVAYRGLAIKPFIRVAKRNNERTAADQEGRDKYFEPFGTYIVTIQHFKDPN